MSDKTFRYYFGGKWYESVGGMLKEVKPEGEKTRREVDEKGTQDNSRKCC